MIYEIGYVFLLVLVVGLGMWIWETWKQKKERR